MTLSDITPKTIRVGWFIHAAFISIIIIEIFLGILFFQESNKQYFKNLHTGDYNHNIVDFLDRDGGTRYLQNIALFRRFDPSIQTYRHRLIVQRLSDIISLQAQPEWNGLRACRTIFGDKAGQSEAIDTSTRFDSCFGLPDHIRDGRERGRYLVIHIATVAALGEKSKGGLNLDRFGRIEVGLKAGAKESRFLIARQRSSRGELKDYIPTVFHQLDDGRIGEPVKKTNCVIKGGFGSAAGTGSGLHYLCQIPMDQVSIFADVPDPYAPAFLASIHPWLTIFPFDERLERLSPSFSTTSRVNGVIEDLEGEPVQSVWSELPAMDHPAYDERSLLRLCIKDQGGALLAGNPDACTPSALSHVKPLRSLSGLQSYLYFDNQAFRRQWFSKNRMLIIGYVAFILFTLLTYRIIVANVLAPIRDIAAQAETIDLLNVNSVKYVSKVEEVASLSRSINSIKFNAATAIKGMLEKQTELLRRLNHDLATPLLVLRARVGSDHPLHRQVQELLAAVERFERGRTVPDAFADRFIKLERQNLAALTKLLVEDHREIAAGSRRFDWSSPSPVVLADVGEVEIREAINHVLNNARRHSEPGGTITLAVDFTRRHVTIAIENDGPPIDNAVLPRIFELGFSTSKESTSLGQGLYAAKTYLNKMGGDIRAENTAVGVRFVISLPNPLVATRYGDELDG